MKKTLLVIAVGFVLIFIVVLGTVNAQGNQTFTVTPTGVDDTVALQAAFDAAVTAGPGSTVELEAGSFCVTDSIVVRGFDGIWTGAGKGNTIIETCTEPDPFPKALGIVIDPFYPDDPPIDEAVPFIFVEVEGGPATNLHLSDLSIHLKGVAEIDYGHGWIENNLYGDAIQVLGKRPTVYDGEISEVTLEVDNVEIKGDTSGSMFGLSADVNTWGGISITGGRDIFPVSWGYGTRAFEPVRVNVNITQSEISRTIWGILTFGPLDSTVTVGGSPQKGNIFDSERFSVVAWDVSNSQIVVSHNQLQGAVQIQQGLQTLWGIDDEPQPHIPLPDNGYLAVYKNNISIVPPSEGVQIWWPDSSGVQIYDYPIFHIGEDAKTLDVVIKSNRFIGAGGESAIDGWPGRDVKVLNNKFTGNFSIAGIMMGYWFGDLPVPCMDWLILGNNFKHSTAGLAHIWLGPNSWDNTVIGGRGISNVLDEGTNNTVVGVNNMQDNPPGPKYQKDADRLK